MLFITLFVKAFILRVLDPGLICLLYTSGTAYVEFKDCHVSSLIEY